MTKIERMELIVRLCQRGPSLTTNAHQLRPIIFESEFISVICWQADRIDELEAEDSADTEYRKDMERAFNKIG